MALIILGKNTCKLCGKTMQEGEKLKSFPAFLPFDHKFGKFSDTAIHQTCFELDPDNKDVDDMLYVWEKIMASIPRDLKGLEEMEAWSQQVFQDWPPKNGVVIYGSIDGDDWWYADKDMWEEFEKAEAEERRQIKERREAARQEEMELLRYDRDDDY